ncbi:MAG: 16S rRNA (cytidine(1402)-2'-O)-methyltransferase [Armatimonadetes bacterium]|nr:16S rRNA (cytidine(1402)-2'-O)-methyltransferase [Armatimonadota bacterium]
MLYVVATPIGNLEDLSARAGRVLAEADIIAAEDTRRAAKLLGHLGLSKRTASFHSYSSPERLAELVEELKAGKCVALISDAGTPCISDPGAELVAAAWQAGCKVVPIPGPCAAVVALSASGVPAGRFMFAGYPPRKAGERRGFLAGLLSAPWPVVFYEAPGRAEDLLRDIAAVGGRERQVVVARELTKVFEEFVFGPAEEVAAELSQREVKGEVTVIVGPGAPVETAAKQPSASELAAWLAREGLPPGRIAAALTALYGLPRSVAYESARRARASKRR